MVTRMGHDGQGVYVCDLDFALILLSSSRLHLVQNLVRLPRSSLSIVE